MHRIQIGSTLSLHYEVNLLLKLNIFCYIYRASVVDEYTAHDEDRMRVRKQIMKNDEEHMRLFGRHTREYLQIQHEDKTSELYIVNVTSDVYSMLNHSIFFRSERRITFAESVAYRYLLPKSQSETRTLLTF